VQTTHEIRVGDARALDLDDASVDLVVTSPPYPMVEMWDESFAAQDPAIGDALEAGDGDRTFEAMHTLLDEVWRHVARVLRPGGIAAVNVGDATRRLDDTYRLYPNHARVIDGFADAGLTQLPGIIWRKPTNSAAKFMGSGTLPTNAYTTLEHEHVLLFRNGGTRGFPPGDDDRYASAYFYEERNEWFSDCWEVRGTRQRLDSAAVRDRSGAFPIEIPHRLISMYSVRGDTVCDPFVGTGTTSLAAMVAGRSSVGIERDADLAAAFETRVDAAPKLSADIAHERLENHRAFVAARDEPPAYEADHYDTRVVTNAERSIRLSRVTAVERDGDEPSRFVATHEPI